MVLRTSLNALNYVIKSVRNSTYKRSLYLLNLAENG